MKVAGWRWRTWVFLKEECYMQRQSQMFREQERCQCSWNRISGRSEVREASGSVRKTDFDSAKAA